MATAIHLWMVQASANMADKCGTSTLSFYQVWLRYAKTNATTVHSVALSANQRNTASYGYFLSASSAQTRSTRRIKMSLSIVMPGRCFTANVVSARILKTEEVKKTIRGLLDMRKESLRPIQPKPKTN
eukprot:gnl/TRDRNA2_/TRDRNA2_176465_c4_seq3.p2 gnl/TRDRNA2_/TRDRNA2_176465_c4~~gnl/TRDRNA2_/TRDRNA2_176465_c4_seq3.p2  ORF type:complete len:128 (+),score=10.71 gnl/TRDRNA2_/TRDRNA2_176465_c4_seq3:164-547(+)